MTKLLLSHCLTHTRTYLLRCHLANPHPETPTLGPQLLRICPSQKPSSTDCLYVVCGRTSVKICFRVAVLSILTERRKTKWLFFRLFSLYHLLF